MKNKNIILMLLVTSMASAQAGWSDWGKSTIWSVKFSEVCDFGKALVNGTLTASQKTNTKIAASVAVGLVAVGAAYWAYSKYFTKPSTPRPVGPPGPDGTAQQQGVAGGDVSISGQESDGPTHFLTPERRVHGAGAGISSAIAIQSFFEDASQDQVSLSPDEAPLSATKLAPSLAGDAVEACVYQELNDVTHRNIISLLVTQGIEKDKTKITTLANGFNLLTVKSESGNTENLYFLSNANAIQELNNGAIVIKTYYVNGFLVVLSVYSNTTDVSYMQVFRLQANKISTHATVLIDTKIIDFPSITDAKKVLIDSNGETLTITTDSSCKIFDLNRLAS